jgi:hypothetical protein
MRMVLQNTQRQSQITRQRNEIWQIKYPRWAKSLPLTCLGWRSPTMADAVLVSLRTRRRAKRNSYGSKPLAIVFRCLGSGLHAVERRN